MNFAFTLFGIFVPVLTFFLLEKFFKLKTRLIKQFKTVRRYKLIIFLVTFVPFLIHSWFILFRDAFINPSIYSLLFLYYYLLSIPEELR